MTSPHTLKNSASAAAVLGLKEHYHLLYRNVDGYSLSNKDKKALNTKSKHLTYGEIDFAGFGDMLRHLNPLPGGTFYDLGAGTGKAVLLAALLGNFKRVVGVELLPSLYLASQEVLTHYLTTVRHHLPSSLKEKEIEFVKGDIFEQDYSDADVVFTQSTCFTTELMRKIADRVEQLKKGCHILSVTYSVEHPDLVVVDKLSHRFGWGYATVYYQQKI
jgi:SAM-dependent methyltransferase